MGDYGYSQYSNQGGYGSPLPEQESNWKIWLIFLIPILIVIIIVVIISIIHVSSKTIPETEFMDGATVELKENKDVAFAFGDEEHFIKLDFIGTDSVNLIIQSEPIKINLKIGEEKEVDVDGDSLADLIVRLEGIENKRPHIYIRRIREEVKERFENRKGDVLARAREVLPEDEFSILKESVDNATNFDDVDKLNKSIDDYRNAFESYTNKSSCAEKWDCGSWGVCANGKQTRTCRDLNGCDITRSKPDVSRSCNEPTNVSGSNLECPLLPEKIKTCEEHTCNFTNSFTGRSDSQRRILGIDNNKCIYNEYIPSDNYGDSLTECTYPLEALQDISEYYRLMALGGNKTISGTTKENGTTVTIRTINGIEYKDPYTDYGNICNYTDVSYLRCEGIEEKIKNCEQYECDLSFLGASMKIKVTGRNNKGLCMYSQEIYGLTKINCNLPESYRNAFAEYVWEDIKSSYSGVSSDKTYEVNETEVTDVLQEAIDNEVCIQG